MVVVDNFPALMSGLVVTVALTAATMMVALVVGIVVALARLSSFWPFRAVAYIYTELFRTLPLLVLLWWFHWSLPILSGVSFPRFLTAIVVFSLNISAVQAEAYRAGMLSIAPSQRQAGLALGMRPWQVMRRVLLPQALIRIMPLTGTNWVSLFKDTALVSLIAVPELMYQGRAIATTTFRAVEVLTAVAVIYFVVVYPQARLVNHVYARLSSHD